MSGCRSLLKFFLQSRLGVRRRDHGLRGRLRNAPMGQSRRYGLDVVGLPIQGRLQGCGRGFPDLLATACT